MKRPGVAIISREYPPFFGGGVGSYAHTLARSLAAAGCRTHVITESHRRGERAQDMLDGVHVHRIITPRTVVWMRRLLGFSIEAARLVRELHTRGWIDVVECPDTEAPAIAALAAGAAGAKRPPIVLSLHTSSETMYALNSLLADPDGPTAAHFQMERACLRLADGLSAPSRFFAQWMQQLAGLTETPEVIPNPLEMRGGATAAIRAPGQALFIGRLERRKGVEPLISAWAHAASTRPNWRLKLVGADGRVQGESMRRRLEALLPESVRAQVEFAGALPPREVRAEIERSAFCIVPSLWENYPYTCAEAMQAGRPVIVGDQGGMSEMIGETEAGLVVPSGEVEPLARALRTFMDESVEALSRRGEAARARIGETCDPAVVIAQRKRLYERAIQTHAQRRGPQSAAALELWRGMREIAQAGFAEPRTPAFPPSVAGWLRAEVA